MRDVGKDLRYIWRQLSRTRMFTTVAVVTLALGIAATTTLATIVATLSAQPIDLAPVDRVYVTTIVEPGGYPRHELQIPEFFALERQPGNAIASVAAVGRAGQTIARIPGRAESVNVESVTDGYADVVGIRPELGRWISAVDNEGPTGGPVAIVSDRIWRQWFNADRSIIDRATITLFPGNVRTIIGVAPAGFEGVQTIGAEIWEPLGHPTVTPSLFANRRPNGLLTLVRARAGVTIDQVTASVRATIANQSSPHDSSPNVTLVPARQVMRNTTLDAALYVIQGFAALVFLAACANLANMLYSRATERAGEIAVRLSLGATVARIRRLFLLEAGVITAASGVLGLALTVVFASLFDRSFHVLGISPDVAFAARVAPYARMSAWVCVEAALAAGLVGFLTAWRSSRVPLVKSMAPVGTSIGADRRGLSLRTILVSVQITAAVVLLITTGVFYENSWKALDVTIDYETAPVAMAQIHQVYAAERATTAEGVARQESERETAGRTFVDRLIPALRAMPNVEHAAVVDALPGSQAGLRATFGLSGLVATHPPIGQFGRPRRSNVSWIHVSPDFFATVGLTMLRGRDLQSTDANGSRVAVVSNSVAAWLWPGEDPLGQEILCCDLSTDPKAGGWRPRTVVGVVADPLHSSDREPLTRPSTYVFLPFERDYQWDHIALVRGSTPVPVQIDQLRTAVSTLDQNAWVLDAMPLDRWLALPTTFDRQIRVLTIAIGSTALAISVLGVYGVVAFFVSRRRREFGVRLALGATPMRVVKLVVDYAIHIVLVGLLPGVFLASIGTRLFEGSLYKLAPNSIATWVEVPLLILLIGIAAAYVPARRASKIDPNITLREL